VSLEMKKLSIHMMARHRFEEGTAAGVLLEESEEEERKEYWRRRRRRSGGGGGGGCRCLPRAARRVTLFPECCC
jgi:hypothetical protein